MIKLLVLLTAVFLVGCAAQVENPAQEFSSEFEQITLAGGCFWCIESAFQDEPGIIDAVSGYTGGDVVDPTYEQVITGTTGHYESVQVTYDESVVSFDEVLDIYFAYIDPTDTEGQFADKGSHYRTAIFYHTKEQRLAAEQALREVAASGRYDEPIVTEVKPFEVFYMAEEYHQDYYKKKTLSYELYYQASGRASHVKESKEFQDVDLKEQLTPEQYAVTQEGKTEKPFNNEYWDHKEAGIYVDVVTGKALFSSTDKYDSGTGWPSFTKTIDENSVLFGKDFDIGVERTEVKTETSHLGHVFDDGPNGGDRFCINSAALRFVPVADMEKEGYSEYLYLFD